MTKAQLRTAIKREARVKSATNLDGLIDDIIADILRDYCNKSRYWETLIEGATITLIAAQQSYSLPEGFINLAAVRYGRGPSPTAFRTIHSQPESVNQTYDGGYPKYYRLVAGPKISFWPFGVIIPADQLIIDYYVDPNTLFTEESDEFPIPRLESAVKKDAIARVQRFSSSLPEAQMTDADANASFIAGESASR